MSRVSIIDKTTRLDKSNWLVYLADTAGSSGIFTGGHSAIYIEGLTSDNKLFLGVYDIFAIMFSKAPATRPVTQSDAFDHGLVTSVRAVEHVLDIKVDGSVDVPSSFSMPSRRRVWVKDVKKLLALRAEVYSDQKKMARCIASSFLEAHKLKGLEHFDATKLESEAGVSEKEREKKAEVTKKLKPLKPGQTKLSRFIDFCESVVYFIEGRSHTDAVKAAVALDFLRFCHKADEFLKENLEKIRDIGVLNRDLIRFRLTGPSIFFYDKRTREERESWEPINCTRWCKDKLCVAEITDVMPIDKPAPTASSCVML